MAEKKETTKRATKKAEPKKTTQRSKVETNKLELLVTIVNRSKAEFYT